MQLANYLVEEAKSVLRFDTQSDFPKRLKDTNFYVTTANDPSVFGHGEIIHNGVSYKIGPLAMKP